MNTVDVIDNFLDQDAFLKIKQTVFSDEFPWYYSKFKVENTNRDVNNYQFVHMFYYDHSVQSNHFEILKPIFNKLDVKALVKVKINLTTSTDKIYEFDLHNDVDFPCKTAIFYINNNDGYTLVSKEKINSIENRIVIFDSEVPHAGSTCCDQSVRVVLNINYFDNKELAKRIYSFAEKANNTSFTDRLWASRKYAYFINHKLEHSINIFVNLYKLFLEVSPYDLFTILFIMLNMFLFRISLSYS